MVLRGQPVGEQGAADRWTALDPHLAGSGAPFLFLHMRPQGPAGFRSGRLVAHFSPYRSDEGPPGPFFHAAGTRGRTAFRARRFPCPAIKEGPVRAPLAALSTLR